MSSQHGEDATIDKLLNYPKKGFYVDVGAHHPEIMSVTKYFYNKGWTGINIEPEADKIKLFREQRPKDINICCAISNYSGKGVLYSVPPYQGLSSLKKEIVDVLPGNIVSTEIATCRLGDLITLLPNMPTFLKIDVEGSEKEVLEGMQNLRPHLICIESTLPNTNIPTHQDWEHILLAKGYKLVETDVVNRYYMIDLSI